MVRQQSVIDFLKNNGGQPKKKLKSHRGVLPFTSHMRPKVSVYFVKIMPLVVVEKEIKFDRC